MPLKNEMSSLSSQAGCSLFYRKKKKDCWHPSNKFKSAYHFVATCTYFCILLHFLRFVLFFFFGITLLCPLQSQSILRTAAEKTLFPSPQKQPLTFPTPDYPGTYDVAVQKKYHSQPPFLYHFNVLYEVVVENYKALAFDIPTQDHRNKSNWQTKD